jgi:hypothetical protein
MTGNIDMLVRAAEALGGLKDKVIFVNGAVVDLFITDPAAPQAVSWFARSAWPDSSPQGSEW